MFRASVVKRLSLMTALVLGAGLLTTTIDTAQAQQAAGDGARWQRRVAPAQRQQFRAPQVNRAYVRPNPGPGRVSGGYRHAPRRNRVAPAAGFAAGVAVGSVVAPRHRNPYPYYSDTAPAPVYVRPAPVVVDDDAAYCAERYESYHPASGTYLGYDGLRHPCPEVE